MIDEVIRHDAGKLKLLADFNLVLVPWSVKWSLYWVRGWGAGPELYVAGETPWVLLSARIRWRMRHQMRLFFSHRWWWRDELNRHTAEVEHD